jgi:hypothetical protein
MKHFAFLLFFFISRVMGYATANDTIQLPGKSNQVTTNGRERYFFSKNDVPVQRVILEKFTSKDNVNLLYVTGFLWVKFIIHNNSNTPRFVLYTNSGHLAGLYIYKPTPLGYQMTPSGKHYPDGREIHNRLPAFFLELQKGETKTFYLKICVENEKADLKYVIRDYAHYIEFSQGDYIIMGLYSGALLLIIIVNLFYYISLKDSIFLMYVIYVLGTFLSNVTIDGFTSLLIPNRDVAYHVSYFCFRFWTDTWVLFTMQLVNLKQQHKLFTTVAYTFIGYHFVLMTALEFINIFNVRENLMAQWENINCTIGILLAFIIVLVSYKNNKAIFKYYVFAFAALIVIVLLLPMYNFGGPEEYLISRYGAKVGTLLEMIALFLAVSQRFRLTEHDLKRKKEEEQVLNDKVLQLETEVKKAQMNPHFMFNALTSIEYFILQNDSRQARSYLGKFSKLMRLTLDHSRSNFVPLQDELVALRIYVELEFLRLNNEGHTFEINIDEAVQQSDILVPPLLIQPFVENAIWHGLQRSKQKGNLFIEVKLIHNELRCTVEDNGIGIKNVTVPNNHKSSGMLITKERLTLIHALLNTAYKFAIEDLRSEREGSTGTRVKFNMPYMLGNY